MVYPYTKSDLIAGITYSLQSGVCLIFNYGIHWTIGKYGLRTKFSGERRRVDQTSSSFCIIRYSKNLMKWF